MQVDELEIKTACTRFGHVSGDFESESKVGALNPKTFEFGEICRVNGFLSNPDIFSDRYIWSFTKMADLVNLTLMTNYNARWLPHPVTFLQSLLQ